MKMPCDFVKAKVDTAAGSTEAQQLVTAAWDRNEASLWRIPLIVLVPFVFSSINRQFTKLVKGQRFSCFVSLFLYLTDVCFLYSFFLRFRYRSFTVDDWLRECGYSCRNITSFDGAFSILLRPSQMTVSSFHLAPPSKSAAIIFSPSSSLLSTLNMTSWTAVVLDSVRSGHKS